MPASTVLIADRKGSTAADPRPHWTAQSQRCLEILARPLLHGMRPFLRKAEGGAPVRRVSLSSCSLLARMGTAFTGLSERLKGPRHCR